MWIFGYGSVMWAPNFSIEQQYSGYVDGYVRRFWQKSTLSRGSEAQPGRTCTLVPDELGRTFGIAYKVPDNEVQRACLWLEGREREGFEKKTVHFTPEDPNVYQSFDVNLFIADNASHYFTHGAESVQRIAQIASVARGESGSNMDYVLRVANVLRKNNALEREQHTQEVEEELLRICKEKGIRDPCFQEFNIRLSD